MEWVFFITVWGIHEWYQKLVTFKSGNYWNIFPFFVVVIWICTIYLFGPRSKYKGFIENLVCYWQSKLSCWYISFRLSTIYRCGGGNVFNVLFTPIWIYSRYYSKSYFTSWTFPTPNISTKKLKNSKSQWLYVSVTSLY